MNIGRSNLLVKPWLPIAILLIFTLSQVPFMSADPDIYISDSRGPFTDEGLNTIQVRNFVNHGYLSVSECDNLLKTPLFAFSLYIPYEIFGTHLLVSRWLILLLVSLPLIFISRKKAFRLIIVIFTLISLFQYQVFQFSHFSLAEMISTICIIMALYFYSGHRNLLNQGTSRP